MRVAAELRPAFEDVRRVTGLSVDRVQVCGDLPNLRTVAMPLIEELDIEVDTLDWLGEDAGAAPLDEGTEMLREHVVSLRLAWAAAATDPVVKLSPPNTWDARAHRGLRIAVGGLTAAATVMVAVALWPGAVADRPNQPRQVAMAQSAGEPVPDAVATTGRRDVELPTATHDDLAGLWVTSEPVDSMETEPVAGDRLLTEKVPDEPAPIEQPAIDESPFVPALATPARTEPQVAEAVVLDVEDFAGEVPAATGIRVVTSSPEPLPVVRSILYSSDRRLAIVGSQIVGVGDFIGSAVVTDITPDTVLLRMASGAERRLVLTYGSADRVR